MAGVGWGEALAEEDVAEVGAAGGAFDLGAGAVGVGKVAHGAVNFLIEAGPAAAGVELGGGEIKRGAAAAAEVGALLEKVVVLPAEGALGPLVDDDALFFWCERVHRADAIRKPGGALYQSGLLQAGLDQGV